MIDWFGSDSDEWDDDELGADLAEAVSVFCPYCGEGIDLGVDQGGGGMQEYVKTQSDVLMHRGRQMYRHVLSGISRMTGAGEATPLISGIKSMDS